MRVSWNTAPEVREALADEADVGAWLQAVNAAEPVEMLTRARTTDTAIVDTPRLGRVVRKRWRWPGVTERLRGLGRTTALARTPAEREFAALGRTYGFGTTTFHPPPLAALVERRGVVAHRAMLLLTEIPDCVDLAEFLRDEEDRRRRRAVLADLAARLAAMHAEGIADGDCHPRNVLVERGAERTWKVDCGRQRAAAGPVVGRRAEYDLACLDVGLARFASQSERCRALAAYLSARSIESALRPWSKRVTTFAERIAPEETRRLPTSHDT